MISPRKASIERSREDGAGDEVAAVLMKSGIPKLMEGTLI
jgi:hypothetical protein